MNGLLQKGQKMTVEDKMSLGETQNPSSPCHLHLINSALAVDIS